MRRVQKAGASLRAERRNPGPYARQRLLLDGFVAPAGFLAMTTSAIVAGRLFRIALRSIRATPLGRARGNAAVPRGIVRYCCSIDIALVTSVSSIVPAAVHKLGARSFFSNDLNELRSLAGPIRPIRHRRRALYFYCCLQSLPVFAALQYGRRHNTLCTFACRMDAFLPSAARASRRAAHAPANTDRMYHITYIFNRGATACRRTAGPRFVRRPRGAERPSPLCPQAGRAQSSAASSSSPPSGSARICSAMRPAFWRIAASTRPAMSGFAFRNCLAFSRPWPMRWLS